MNKATKPPLSTFIACTGFGATVIAAEGLHSVRTVNNASGIISHYMTSNYYESLTLAVELVLYQIAHKRY